MTVRVPSCSRPGGFSSLAPNKPIFIVSGVRTATGLWFGIFFGFLYGLSWGLLLLVWTNDYLSYLN